MKKLLAFACACVAALCAAAEVQQEGLSAYKGKDLRKLDEKGLMTFMEEFRALTGDKPEEKSDWGGFEPWWVDQIHSGEAAWVFLEAYPGYAIPDMSAMRVNVFDKNWKRICKQSFPTGYRFFLGEVKIEPNKALSQDLLVATVTCAGPFMVVDGEKKGPAFEQGWYQKQYYALSGTNVVMVRLEDDKGLIARNHYAWSAPPKGPPVPSRTKEEWIKSLQSTNAVDQLATLVWLTGGHLSSREERKPDHNQESVADSRLFESVRDDPRTERILQELKKHENKWIHEYAELGTLKEKD